MARNKLSIAVAALVIVVLVLQLVAFRVRENERAVVKTFGKASPERVKEAGLHWKWPWPVEEVVRYDARLRVLEGPLEETQTADKKSVLVGCFATWRPGDPIRFLERVDTPEAAERALEQSLRAAQSSTLSRATFDALITTDRARLRWDDLEKEIKARLEKSAQELGIEVVQVGIRRLALPKDTTETVFQRMTAERDVKAKETLAQGQAEADRIRAEAEAARDKALDAARAEARKVVAEAERDSREAYQAFEAAPDFAIFLRKLEALRRGLSGRTTLVFDTGSPPFDLLAPRAGVAPVSSR